MHEVDKESPFDSKTFDREAPSGTVTFLFTDIESSTKLLERLHEQYAVILDEQRQILRTAFTRWDGRDGRLWPALFPGHQRADYYGAIPPDAHAND